MSADKPTKLSDETLILPITVTMTRARLPIAYVFTPQPDITAYELAQCLPYLLPGAYVFSLDELGEIKRHFKERP